MSSKFFPLLDSLGLSARYAGFRYLALALDLAVRDPQILCSVTKRLYPEIARQCGTNWKAVERSIRTAISTIWLKNPQALDDLAGFPLPAKPAPARFIALLLFRCQSVRR